MARYKLPTYREGTEILHLPEVTRALHAVADVIAPRARQLATSEGLDEFAAAVSVKDGTRPKGRPYSYVIADTPEGERDEWGDTNTARHRILRRAGGV
jgi:hypothetical protein